MKTLFRTGLIALVAGLISSPAMADTESYFTPGGFEYHDETVAVDMLPPGVRKEVEKILRKRKAGYRSCAVHANACARNCGLKYREKVRQELCFKTRKCREAWNTCIVRVQDAHPVGGFKENTKP
jgi:hypothetical protein